jgi:serine/threonine protein kinase
MAESRRTDWVGRVVDGRYQILSVVGTGGMGVTYLASDQRHSGRKVAVKVPHQEFLAIRNFRDRFVQEIHQLTEREHPHIVKLYDSGQLEDVPYAVLQYLPGGSLRQRIEGAGGKLTADQVMTWLPAISDALDFMHDTAVHRDVKPENVLFDAEGHAFLVDFGIAKVLSDPMLLTETGVLLGSPPYMAPEAATGRPLGGTYDQYALAVVVYEALSGVLPHDGGDDHIAWLVQKATQPPRPLRRLNPDVPVPAADAIMRALSPEPSHRFDSCRQFAAAFGGGLGVRDRSRPIGVGVGVALIVTASLVGLFWQLSAKRTGIPLGGPPVQPAISTESPRPQPTPENLDSRNGDVKWEGYQRSMVDAFATILGDDDTLRMRPPEKAARWRSFLAAYGTDNPQTVEDDRLRRSAQSRLERWERQIELAQRAPRSLEQPSTAPAGKPAIGPTPTEPPSPAEPGRVNTNSSADRDSQAEAEQRRQRTEQVRAALSLAGQSLDRADYEAAVRAYETVLALEPDNAPALTGIERARRAQAAESRVLNRLKEPK